MEGTYPPFNSPGQDRPAGRFRGRLRQGPGCAAGREAPVQPCAVRRPVGRAGIGSVDVVINQITITPERQAKYDFSEPYTISGHPDHQAQGQARPGEARGPGRQEGRRGPGDQLRAVGPRQRARRPTCAPMTTIRPSIRTCAPAASMRC
ncbi:transporter substrate-binding domain-containing protein [Caulobacter segnis]